MRNLVLLLSLGIFVGSVMPAAAFSKSRLEKVQARAASEQKLIAFVAMQECKNGGCPKAVQSTADRNSVIKRATPRTGVIVVALDADDLADANLIPEVIRKALGNPGIVIANADCTQVIDNINSSADKTRIAEMDRKIAAASKSK